MFGDWSLLHYRQFFDAEHVDTVGWSVGFQNDRFEKKEFRNEALKKTKWYTRHDSNMRPLDS